MTSNRTRVVLRLASRSFGLVVAGIGLLAGCGDSDDGGPAAGAACVDGDGCGSGLYCFIKGPEPSGVCTALPASCGGEGDCDPMSECGDAMGQACGTSSSCMGIMGKYVVSCTQSEGNMRKEGESCSQLVGCQGGLVCVSPGTGESGVCNVLPSSCGAAPSCSSGCLDAVCTAGITSCMSIGDRATVVCK